MPPNPTIENLFSSLATELDVEQLVVNRQQEGLYLEFKQKRDPTNGDLATSDAKHFSKALSGFANADGGVLIWGIETDREEKAAVLHPVSGVHRFQAAPKASIANSTQPVVDDVLVDVVTAAGPNDRGFVKCLIPASDKVPHRAVVGDREYYRRSAEGFYRLEHFDLEDLFGRRPRPLLNVLAAVARGSSSGGGSRGTTQEVRVTLSITNGGRGSARAPFVELLGQIPHRSSRHFKCK